MTREGALVEVLDARVGTNAGSVLIVEDDPDIRDVLTIGLEVHGWEVNSVATGNAALEAAKRADPDVIVLDLGLPDIDGRDVLAALKGDPLTEWVPVVVVSAWGTREMIIELLRAGAQDFVVKPFDRQELEARLAAARRVSVKHRALAASELEYRLLVERTKDVVLRWALDGTIHYASPSVAEVLGRDAVDVMGRALQDLAHPDDLAALFAPLAEALLRPAESFRMQFRLRHADGRWIAFESAGSASLDPGTGQPEIHASLRDITERLAAEAEVRAAEERFRKTFDEAPIGIALVAPDGRFLRVNRALCRIVGYADDELLTKTFQDITHPDDLDTDVALVNQVLNGELHRYQLEKRYLHADGHQVWIQLNVSLVRDADGVPLHFVAQILDVSDRRRREEELREATERFSQSFELAPIGMALVGLDGTMREVNRRLCAMLGYPAEELCGRQVSDVAHPDELAMIDAELAGLASGEMRSDEGEVRFVAADGREVFTQVAVASITGADGAPSHLVVQLQDITDQRLAQELLVQRALHDPLTGLPNRTLLMERLSHALTRSEREVGLVGVLFLDLDRFKVVNDSVGHDAGDQLLIEVADRLLAVVRPGDTVARLGGDEFVVLAEHLHGLEDLALLAERIQAIAAEPYVLEDGRFVCTASIGLALADHGQAAHELLREADAAMYRAKERGKDRHEVFDAALRDLGQARVRTEQILRRALEEGGIEVEFQPIIDVASGRIVAAEALARVRHLGELLQPGQFMEAAEESGLVVPLGAQVLEETVRAAGRLRKQFGDDVLQRVSVNVSARQVGLPDFASLVQRVIADHDLPPRFLCLELTETTLLAATHATAQGLQDLKAHGVSLAIDDFGTGYSSLTYLRRFPVDCVKIDRSFVDGVPDEPDDTSIVTAVIGLAQSLNLHLVAEGVEQPEQLEFLAAHGCQLAQGYLFARPMPEAELVHLIADQRGD